MVHKNRTWVQHHPRTLLKRFNSLLCCLIAILLWTTSANAQTTIATTLANNNGSSVVVFSFQNNNTYDVIVTDIGSFAGSAATYSCYLYAKTATYNVAPGAVGAVSAANGWVVAGSNTNLPLAANLTGTGLAATPFITGMNYTVPAMTHVRFCLQLATGAGMPAFTSTSGSLRYSTVAAQTCLFSGGGVDLNSCTNYGYGGTLSSPTNSPRGFVGYISFMPAVACSGAPTPGNTMSTASPVCPSALFTLSLQNSQGTGTTYQWQSSTDGGTTWNNFGTNAGSQTLTQTVSTMYQCNVTCTNSGLSATSTPITVSMTPFYSCYCASSATSTADEDILGVQVGSMNNTSNCSTVAPGPGSVLNMYGNYQGYVTPATVSQGQSVPFNITLGYCGSTAYSNVAAMYIDYNQDGVYDPSTELIATKAYGAGTLPSFAWSGSFTVPLSATLGTTGMRIVYVESSTVSPCGTYSWGETEDYNITIVASTNCTGAPAASTTLSNVTNVCPSTSISLSLSTAYSASGLTFQWQRSTDGGTTWVNFGTNDPFANTTISANTMFHCVITCTYSGLSTTSTPVTVNVNPFYSCYCASSAQYTADEDILGVQVGSMNNTSNCSTPAPGPGSVLNMYGNYQGYVTPATVSQGVSVPFNITLGYCGTYAYSNIAAMYIDYNQDGVYDPSTELVATKAYGAGTLPSFTWSGSFTVPYTATLGTTGMRIVYVEGSTVSPCGTYGWGETEDYNIIISIPPTCLPPTGLSGVATGFSTANVSWTAPSPAPANGYEYAVTTSSTPPASGTAFAGTSTSVSGLTPNTNYYLHVRSYCGGSDYSPWSTSAVFATPIPNQIGTTGSTTAYFPIYSCYGYSYSQQIYLASEYSAAVGASKTHITKIRFYYATAATTTNWNTWTVYLGNTSKTSFSSSADWVPLASLQQVFSGALTIPAAGNWMEITLTTPFDWDGSSNLVVAVDENVSGYNCTAYWGSWTASANRGILYYSDGTNPDPASPPSANYGPTSAINAIQFDAIALLPCAGTPAPGNTVASVNPACSTDNLVLSTSNAMTDLGLTFDWQTSPDGVTWTSTGVTTPTYTVNQTAATYYQCVVTCTNSGLSATSTPVYVTQVICFCTTPVYSYNATYDMCAYYDYIGNFTFAGINNTTTCSNTPPYYNYYSSQTATVDQTGTYPVTISATPGGASFQLYKVYIDFNDNGSFDDAGEMVYTSGFISTATNFTTGNIYIPITAPIGTHRMRVRSTNPLNTGIDANSCSDDGYLGEVEDYNITINPAPACSGTPSPGATLSNKPLACASTVVNLSLQNTTPGTGVTYQWQSAPDASFATPTNLGTAATQTATQTATTYYRCLVTCGGNTGISTPVMVYFTTNCYCTQPTVVSDGCGLGLYINNVTFAGINNTSGCYNSVPYTYPYYSFFPTQTASVTQGGVYPFSVSSPNQATGYYQWYGVWIDYNDNGSFEDAGELVLSSVAGATATNNSLTGNITIPLSSVPGVHLMRVRSANVSAAINSCSDNAVSGETEDYLIDITAAPSCAGTPAPGNTLSTKANACATDNFTLSLQNNPILSGYTYQWQKSTVSATGPWTNVGTNANTYTATQSVVTWYQCIVTCANGGASAASTPVQVGMTVCYCTPSYTSYDDDYISNVTLNTINNTTGYTPNPSYTDYSGTIQTTLIQGQTYTISVTNGSTGWSEYVAAWIDWNQDGFDNPGDLVLGPIYTASGTAATATFTVPLTAVSGSTKMRAIVQYSSSVTPCPTSGYGEAEDYGIILGDPNCVLSPIAPANASLVCPDPSLALSWAPKAGATGYDVYFDNVNGSTLVSPNQPGTTYNPGVLTGTGPFYWKVVPLYSSGSCTTPQVWSFSLKPSPIPVASSGGDVCQGADIYLTGDNVDPGQTSGNTFAWTGPNGFSSTQQNPIISGPSPAYTGTYTLVVTNQFGCSGSSTTDVSVNPNPTLTLLSYQNVGCIGGSDGSITIGASGGLANYDFTVDFSNFINDPAQATFTNLPEGPTTVYVSDANGCLSTISPSLTHINTVAPTQNVIVPISGMPGNACPGTTANLSVAAVANATMYTWDGPPGTTFNGNPSP
ncbi:MAG: fibronectin type III domain-containing protein, partial [Bacteroidetes bacterium]|nr:fibronectin type III domain-containing protein [Bacteroidota bacterium]